MTKMRPSSTERKAKGLCLPRKLECLSYYKGGRNVVHVSCGACGGVNTTLDGRYTQIHTDTHRYTVYLVPSWIHTRYTPGYTLDTHTRRGGYG